MDTDKSKFIKGAKEVFDLYPETDKVIVTGDHNYFFPAAIGLARDHCRRYGTTMIEITRDEVLIAETKPIEEYVDLPGGAQSEVPDQEAQPEKAKATHKPKKQP